MAENHVWSTLSGNECFGSFDFLHAYFQFEIHPEQRKYACFSALGKVYCLNRLPQGATNSGFNMQAVITSTLRDILGKGIVVQADDGLLYAKDWRKLAATWRLS